MGRAPSPLPAPGARHAVVVRASVILAIALFLNAVRDRAYTQEALGNLRRADLWNSSRGDLSSRAESLRAAAERSRRAGGFSARTVPGRAGRSPDAGTAVEQLAPVDEPVDQRIDARQPERLSAFERQLEAYGDPLVDRPIRQFGYDVFGKRRTPLLDTPVGKDYVLGVGDRLVISVWGNIEIDEDFFVDIDRRGQIRLPMLGPIAVKGLTLGRAEDLLRRRLDRFYQNYDMQVGLAEIRDMPVHVTGHVAVPGRVRLPSVATLFDAIGAAGGVTKEGTLRAVRLRRGDEPERVVDLYEYLIGGDRSVDVHLAPNDVVLVPSVGTRIAVVGRVLRPAIYEHRDDRISLAQIVAMAGGHARLANRGEVQIESSSSRGLSIRAVDLEETAAEDVHLNDGDVVVVRPASPRLENVVYLRGNVSQPGRYALAEGMRIADVVTDETLVEAGFWVRRTPPVPATPGPERSASGDPRSEGSTLPASETGTVAVEDYPEPFLEYALLSRIDARTKQESRIAFHLGRAIIERDPRENHVLQPQDTIIVFPRDDFESPRTVFVSGAVHRPDTYTFYPGMRVLDLIRMAGGLRPEAHYRGATLTRIHPNQDGTEYEHILVEIDAVLAGDQASNLELQQNDSLTVRQVPEFRKAYRVAINGEVRHPGTYSVIPGERLSDLLRRAGGFTEHAYLPAARFIRESVREMQQERLDESLQRLETEAKLSAQEFTAEASAVDEKTELAAEQARIDRLLDTLRSTQASGRMVVRIREPSDLEGKPDDVELADGDSITIPRRPEVVHVVGAVFNQNAILHRTGVNARRYLEECGGPLETADMDVAYIIRADGSADSARHARKNYRWDAERFRYSRGSLLSSELHPGDTLVIPHDIRPRISRLGLTKTITQIMFQAAVTTGVVIALF